MVVKSLDFLMVTLPVLTSTIFWFFSLTISKIIEIRPKIIAAPVMSQVHHGDLEYTISRIIATTNIIRVMIANIINAIMAFGAMAYIMVVMIENMIDVTRISQVHHGIVEYFMAKNKPTIIRPNAII